MPDLTESLGGGRAAPPDVKQPPLARAEVISVVGDVLKVRRLGFSELHFSVIDYWTGDPQPGDLALIALDDFGGEWLVAYVTP